MAKKNKVVRTFKLREDTWWGANTFMARVCLGTLEQYKAAPRNGEPMTGWDEEAQDYTFLTPQEWEATIDRMIRAFRLLVLDGEGELIFNAERSKAIDDGLLDFAVYFRDLWD